MTLETYLGRGIKAIRKCRQVPPPQSWLLPVLLHDAADTIRIGIQDARATKDYPKADRFRHIASRLGMKVSYQRDGAVLVS